MVCLCTNSVRFAEFICECYLHIDACFNMDMVCFMMILFIIQSPAEKTAEELSVTQATEDGTVCNL